MATLERQLREQTALIANLKQQVAELFERIDAATRKDWRRTVGMFSGDEMMKRIDEAGRRIREADRARARRGSERADRRSKQ